MLLNLMNVMGCPSLLGFLVVACILCKGSGVALYRCSSFKKITGSCDECHSRCRLPVIRTKQDYESVKKKMHDNHVTATWLGLRRVWLGEYLWLDCSKPFQEFVLQNWTKNDPNCVTVGVYALDSSRLEPWKCTSRRPSLCQINGCESCSSVKKLNQCWKEDDTCFVVVNHRMDWERARVVCQQMGGSLAIIKKKPLLKKLQENIRTKTSSNYWVGLRREEWTYPNMELVPLRITTIHWDKEEPKDRGNCSIMIRHGKEYVWKVASCTAKYNALCIKPGEHIDPWSNSLLKIPTNASIPNVTNVTPTTKIPNAVLSSTEYPVIQIGDALIAACAIFLAALLGLALCKTAKDPNTFILPCKRPPEPQSEERSSMMEQKEKEAKMKS